MRNQDSTTDRAIHFLEEDTTESLKNFFNITNVLTEQRIIRSSKYSADIAEYICAKLFELELCESQREVGYDALDLQGNKVQIKINNSMRKTNQDIGNKAAYDYLYLVVTVNSLMFNSQFRDAFMNIYIIPSEEIAVERYIAKSFIKNLSPALVLNDKFEILKLHTERHV